MSDSWSEPVIGVDGTIYVCMDDMYIWAIRPGGTVAWIRQLGLSGSFTLAASANDLIYAACDEGLIYVLDSNGSLVSCFKGNQRLSHPVLSPDGMLYIGDSSGKLWAIGSGDCQIGDHLLYPAGDQNLDIQVNLTDFEIISNNWLTDTSSQQWVFEESDLNRDYLTNLEDLMIFCNNWLYSE
jgi:outer membrane protein assembly factor BamB